MNASRAMGKVFRDKERLKKGDEEHSHTEDTLEAIRLAMDRVAVSVAPSASSTGALEKD